MNNNESTGNLEFEQWANKLEHMSDQDVSYEIYQRILNHHQPWLLDYLDIFDTHKNIFYYPLYPNNTAKSQCHG